MALDSRSTSKWESPQKFGPPPCATPTSGSFDLKLVGTGFSLRHPHIRSIGPETSSSTHPIASNANMDIILGFIKRSKETLSKRFGIKFLNFIYDNPIVLIFFMYNIGDGIRCFVSKHSENRLHQHVPDKCMNLETAHEDDVQKQATNYKILSNVPALILGLFCEAWSDKHGRKLPKVLLSIGTTKVKQVNCYVHASQYICHTDICCPFPDRYVVDTTGPSERTNNLGLLGAMRFFGMFIGTLIAGLLLDNTNVLTTLYLLHSISL
ncbi:LOW QUALITY PROTEIN: hypothetical protein MAR_036991 [Mya arenaria]|uniref:Uncharacterized protein n=1 Tax=Mya arenaria TaxID=6604 RepID=A0ABY7FQK6_MYAAR|nr:LOW QUALITY PROTEIN: hypothetical protein MAR_036991 [Mya arenaria]